jgi:hypothetical protein
MVEVGQEMARTARCSMPAYNKGVYTPVAPPPSPQTPPPTCTHVCVDCDPRANNMLCLTSNNKLRPWPLSNACP